MKGTDHLYAFHLPSYIIIKNYREYRAKVAYYEALYTKTRLEPHGIKNIEQRLKHLADMIKIYKDKCQVYRLIMVRKNMTSSLDKN